MLPALPALCPTHTPEAEKPHLGPGCVLGTFHTREGLPGSCTGRAPQTSGPADSQQLLWSSFCFFHLVVIVVVISQLGKQSNDVDKIRSAACSAGQCCLILILAAAHGHLSPCREQLLPPKASKHFPRKIAGKATSPLCKLSCSNNWTHPQLELHAGKVSCQSLSQLSKAGGS